LNRLASVLTPPQLDQITTALSNGTVTAALLTEVVNQVQTSGACAGEDATCRELCAEVLAQCIDCTTDRKTYASLMRMCKAL
jgi:hypothetical protein